MARRKYSAKFKSRVALEAIREQKTLAELAAPTQLPLGNMKVNFHCTRLHAELSKEYEVSVNQISLWKQEVIRNMDMLFGGDRSRREIKEKNSQINGYTIEDSVVPYVFDYATVYNNIGWAYCCQGRYSEGLPYAEKFVAMNPDHDYSWEMIGEIYYYLGRYDDCMDAMTKSLEFPVCHYEEYARRFLGEAYVKLGEKEKGEEELKRAAELRNASAGGQVAAVDSVKVYLPDSVDEQPQFVGGTDARRRYIAEKVIYPSEEKERGHQGTVVVSLIVERDGPISEVRVEEGVCPTLSHEAAEVVRCMPAWEPGTIDGVPVRVRLTLPVTFALQ